MDFLFKLIHQNIYIKIGKTLFGKHFGEDRDKTSKLQKLLVFILVLIFLLIPLYLIFWLFPDSVKYYGPP